MTRLCCAALILIGLAPAPVSADDKIVIGPVSLGSPIQWPLWIAIEKGFAAREGIVLDPIAAGSNSNVLQQTAAGALHIGLPVAGDAFRAIDKGAPLKMIRTDIEHAPHTVVAKPAIKSFADLQGKVISIGTLQGLDRIYLDRKLSRAGLRSGEYDVLAAGATSNRFSALMAGAIDAAALSAPLNFASVAKGFNDLGSVELEGEHFPYSGFVAYAPWLEQNRPLVVRYLKAYARAVAWFNDRSNKAEAAAIILKWGKGRLPDAERTYDLYQRDGYFLPAGTMTREDLIRYINLLLEAKWIERAGAPERFVDLSLAEQANRELALER
jgi:ABC-type nitrate/sulfonate/bicarbonate transport system substrate-binding protein